MTSDVVHNGGCHCRRVRWQVEAPASVVAWICNCSDCSMRGNTHFVVPADKFALQPGADDSLTTYTFGTHTAKHKFCKVCGITSFYIPRSNPDGIAVTAACVDPGTLAHVEYRKADGKNWEKWFEKSDISEFSKPAAASAAE
ncbi:centromere protein V-like [Lolium rigidum]|uniref:centromere protein V-like n=1 Tax=Lolium rigidum TaxID=89674 RepID=UPI001F5DC3C7|nr:centromere protein V-like [Lolium rigidum]